LKKIFFPKHPVFAVGKISRTKLSSRFLSAVESMYFTFMNSREKKIYIARVSLLIIGKRRVQALVETFIWAYIIYKEPRDAIRAAFIYV